MSLPTPASDFARWALRASEAAPGAEGRRPPRVAVDEQTLAHPLLPGRAHIYVEWAGETLRLHAGSFRALAKAHPGVDVEEAVEAHVAAALEDARTAAETRTAGDGREQLYLLHARFRRGEELPHAWYRQGETLGGGAWAVDLDVFQELWLDRRVWQELPGTKLELALGEEPLRLALPDDADPAEILTLPGAGLVEDPPGDDEAPPDAGDLHLVFFVV